jgi:exonuclease VII large subunit
MTFGRAHPLSSRAAGDAALESGLAQDGHPSGGGDHENRSIRRLHALVAGQVIAAARSRIPTESVRVWGEVVDVREGDECWFIELMDAKVDGLLVSATVPRRLEPPDVGHTVGIDGHLRVRQEGPAVIAELRGTGMVTAGVSSRSRARRALLDEVRSTTPAPVDVATYRGGAIVLVTSSASRSVGDFQRNLGFDPSALPLTLEEVRLHDAEDVARGVLAAADRPGTSMVVVMRGGGDAGELAVFSSAEVTRAVATVASRIPVIVGIGHASDWTLADEVASRSASTPSQAARVVGWVWRRHLERPTSAPAHTGLGRLRISRRTTTVLFLVLTALAYFLGGRFASSTPPSRPSVGTSAGGSTQPAPSLKRERSAQPPQHP